MIVLITCQQSYLFWSLFAHLVNIFLAWLAWLGTNFPLCLVDGSLPALRTILPLFHFYVIFDAFILFTFLDGMWWQRWWYSDVNKLVTASLTTSRRQKCINGWMNDWFGWMVGWHDVDDDTVVLIWSFSLSFMYNCLFYYIVSGLIFSFSVSYPFLHRWRWRWSCLHSPEKKYNEMKGK